MARPFRHTFILLLVGLGTCMAAFGGWRFARASAPVNGPIILLSISGLRADRLPVYGYTNARTPAIDALAADGVVFERAYSNIPQTLPAHAALLSGRLPFDTGVRDGVGFTVKPAERLLPEMLRDRGFSTAGVVSSYLLRKDTGISKGFAFFDADLPAAADGSLFEGLHRRGEASEQIAERWLDSVGTDRAFLFLNLDEPRAAVAAAAGAPIDSLQSDYDAAVADADHAVGRLVRYLRAHQLYDRSTILLVSDHGQGLGDHGEQAHGLFLYDEALHVPLIVKRPAGEDAGRRINAVAEIVDIVPTILDLAKAPDPGGLRGRSLNRLIGNDAAGSSTPRFVYAESMYGAYHFGWSELRSVTDGRFRYIAAPRPELYDLTLDPGERDNLVETRPEVAATMIKALKEFDHGNAPVVATAVTPVDTAVRQRLEVLGYVGIRAEPDGVAPGDEAIDAKDKFRVVDLYRAAVVIAASPEPAAAIDRFKALTRAEPASADLWLHLADTATRNERHDLAYEAFARALELTPHDPVPALGLASASLRLRKLEDARQHAELVVEESSSDKTPRAAAHELLARVALARRDEEGARAEALLAEESDPNRPVAAYVEGRIAHEQGRFTAAAESFDGALASAAKSGAPIPSDLQYYAADTLLHLNRASEAEYLFVQALKTAPLSPRNRAGLAAVYRATGRSDEAAAALAAH